MPRHASPDDGASAPDDDLARLLADPDAFVRGGPHEPPARTRAALARHGDQATSWRQAAPLTAVDPRVSRRRRRPRPVLALVLTLVVAGAVVAGVVRWQSGRPGPPDVAVSAPAVAVAPTPIAPDPTTTAVGASTTAPSVDGLSATAPVGTCYRAPTEDSDLDEASCDDPHDVELVSHEVASGADGTYPADDYWSGPVQRTCYADAVAYVGGERSVWPAGAEPRYYRPTETSWQVGDRDVECVVRLTPAVAGSVAGAAVAPVTA